MEWASNRQLSRWSWIALLWSVVGLFDATQTVVVMHAEGMQHAWPQLFVTLLFSWLPWALATPIVMYLARRFPVVHLRPLSTWLVHFLAAAAINLIYAGWRAAMEAALNPWANPRGPGTFTSLWSVYFNNAILATVIFYVSILGATYILDSRERLARQQMETARLNEQLSKAQLDALRHQIEPHFLFNALNAVASLVRENRNDDAVGMIAGLSDLLRHLLRDSRRQQVPLREELELLEKYMAIQKVRFSDRLHVEQNIPTNLLLAQVPRLLLQPIVENSLKHGIAKRAQGGRVRIAVARENGNLMLRIYNDGPKLSPDWKTTSSGVGLSNLQSRLQGLYGTRFEFELENAASGGVEAKVLIPYALRPEES